ncbi:MAG: DUF1566 domain-containing protein [Anaerolineales bacterium]
MKIGLWGIVIMAVFGAAGCAVGSPMSPSGLTGTSPLPATTPVLEPDRESVELPDSGYGYPVVDTGQGRCYDNLGSVIVCPIESQALFGQDAQYQHKPPDYTDNGDGTILDNVTGLMWSGSPDLNGDGRIDAADKLSYEEALAGAETFRLAGYRDWRLPSIKELYSLILFDGTDPSALGEGGAAYLIPFLDTRYFEFAYGDTGAGERLIDSQFASGTLYSATTMNGARTMFGVNFADGRIKGYPADSMPGRGVKSFFVLYVRGGEGYGVNDYLDNDDGTIRDHATGLTWEQVDSGLALSWEAALAYCENLDLAGYDDWRLPDIKELQSIVDYTRSPGATGSAAIDPLFQVSSITNEAGQPDYPYYWSSTTHASSLNGIQSAYIAFGRALGFMNGAWTDVHGAGAQRSDPKTGRADDYPNGHGPQGDAVRVENFARCVRGGEARLHSAGNSAAGRDGILVEVHTSDLQMNQIVPEGKAPQGAVPRAALEACSSLIVDAPCTFQGPLGVIGGTCASLPSGQLACLPPGAPGQ